MAHGGALVWGGGVWWLQGGGSHVALVTAVLPVGFTCF